MDYGDEFDFSDEQQQEFSLLIKLSDTINDEIKRKRENAIEALLDENLRVSKKKNIMREYVHDRIFFNNQKVSIEKIDHTYDEILILAKKLYDDKTFMANDTPYVINGLAYYENSISFDDIVIAFHNYRLDNNEENLWWLSLLLCRYVYATLSMESIYKDVSFESTDSCDELRKLTDYVVDFWNKYLKNVEVKTYELIDDNKRDFYDKIEDDASNSFVLDDAEDKDERKQIDANYAAQLVRQCSKSLYLLLSTIKKINDLNYYDFSIEIKKLRTVMDNICDRIYSNVDAYHELETDNRLNFDQMELIEKNNENRLLKYNLQCALNDLKRRDTEAILIDRQEALKKVNLVDSKELIEDFVEEYSKLLKQSIPDNLCIYYEKLKAELDNKYSLIPEKALNTLASAEYLYDMFVRKKAPEGFDYSGIAMLYFQAFETVYNKLLIEPYSDWLKKQEVDKLYEERRNLKKKRTSDRTQEQKNRLEKIENILKQYFSKNFDIDYFYINNFFVTCLEIGKFQRFIDLGDCLNKNQAKQLVFFLESDCFKKQIDKGKIEYFAQAVKNAIAPRNKAAHGLNVLEETDVMEDKVIVYDETNIKDILNFKNILYSFLEFYK